MNDKIVIYTCITGNYDSLQQPESFMPEIDYICFMPKGEKQTGKAGIWKIIEFNVPSNDASINSRYPKMMPHLFLQDYGYSLYIDANVKPVSAKLYELLKRKIEDGALFCAPSHPVNDCVYDEAELILKTRKDSLLHLLKTVHFLKSENFPTHFGLYENNVIFRRHSHPSVIATDNMWWQLFLKYPKRDQLLLTYCLWKKGLLLDYLLPIGTNARNSDIFSVRQHLSEKDKKELSFWRRKLSTFPKLLLKLYISKK